MILIFGFFERFSGSVKNETSMNVAILGASDKKDRYSYLALRSLMDKGHKVFPVNSSLTEIDGLKVYPSLSALPEKAEP